MPKKKEEIPDHYPIQIIIEKEEIEAMISAFMAQKGYVVTHVELEDDYARCYARISRALLPHEQEEKHEQEEEKQVPPEQV